VSPPPFAKKKRTGKIWFRRGERGNAAPPSGKSPRPLFLSSRKKRGRHLRELRGKKRS